MQHHDAVAGTEKQHVAYDYAKRICEGVTAGEAIVNDALAMLMTRSKDNPVRGLVVATATCLPPPLVSSGHLLTAVRLRCFRCAQLTGSDFSQCQLLNQSICDPIADLKSFAGVVYNLEAQYVTQDLRIPVCCDDLEVVNATGGVIESLLTPTPAGMSASNTPVRAG